METIKNPYEYLAYKYNIIMNKQLVTNIEEIKKVLSIENIIDKVCLKMQIPYEKIRTKTRKREYVICRQICIYFLNKNKYPKFTNEIIAYHLGYKTASSVNHGLSNIIDLIDTDKDIYKTINDIKKELFY